MAITKYVKVRGIGPTIFLESLANIVDLPLASAPDNDIMVTITGKINKCKDPLALGADYLNSFQLVDYTVNVNRSQIVEIGDAT